MSAPRPLLLRIQYLRGIAAMMVVVQHARNPQPWLFNPLAEMEIGASGVDIFFVISGFIMFHVGRRETPGDFAWRRVTRIAPLYWLATILMLIPLSGRFGTPPPAFGDLLLSLVFIPYHNPLYGGTIWPVLVPGWSLNYEMFFYLLFGVGLVLRAPLRVTCAALGVAVLAGLIVRSDNALWQTYTSPLLLEFGAGLLLGAAHERGWTKPHAWALPVGVAGLIAASLVTPAGGLGFALPAVGIVTGVLALEARGTARAWPIAKLLGDASYAIYLFHPLVLFVLRQLFLRLPIAGWPQFLIFFPVAIVATAACGIVVHLTVETWLARRLRRRRRVTAGAVTQAA